MKIYTGKRRLLKKRENSLYKFNGRKFFVFHDGTYYEYGKWDRMLQVINLANALDLEVYIPYNNSWDRIRQVEYTIYRNAECGYSFILEVCMLTQKFYSIYDVESCANYGDLVDPAKFAEFTKAIFGRPLSQKEYSYYIERGKGDVVVPDIPMFMERTHILHLNA